MNINRLLILLLPLLLITYSLLFFPGQLLAENEWENLRVTEKTVNSAQPEITSTSRGTAAVWNDTREGNDEIYFAHINKDGDRVKRERRITKTESNSITPVILWNGRDYGVFWSEGSNDIYFAKLKHNGKKVLEKHLVGGSGYSVHLSAVWNGSEYGVVWWDARDNTGCPIGGNPRGRAYFMRVSSNGDKIGEEVPVPTELSSAVTGAYRPLIVWTGNDYGIFWTDQRESGTCSGNLHNIYYAKLDQNGNKILGDIKLIRSSSSGNIHVQSVAWNGSNFGLAYGHGTLYFAKMSPSGDTLVSDVVITDQGFSNYPKLAWDGLNYAVAWSSNKAGNDEIYFAKLDTSGNKVGDETRITNDSAPSSFLSNLIFDDDLYKVAWLDQRDDTVDEVYFAQGQ